METRAAPELIKTLISFVTTGYIYKQLKLVSIHLHCRKLLLSKLIYWYKIPLRNKTYIPVQFLNNLQPNYKFNYVIISRNNRVVINKNKLYNKLFMFK